MSRKAPAFHFYVDDFLSGTFTMTDAEVGVYIRLLCLQWSRGSINQGCINGFRDRPTVEFVLREKFEACEDGDYRNRRLEAVRTKAWEYSDSMAENGRKGGRGRAKAIAERKPIESRLKADAIAEHKAAESFPSPFPSPLPNPSPIPPPAPKDTSANRGHVYEAGFENFWSAFPKKRRTKKHEAYRKWKVALQRADADTLTQRASDYANSPKGQGEYAVMPSVWLNSSMWLDEPEAWLENRGVQSTSAQKRMANSELAQLEFLNESN